jgi:hypothetical protein
MWKEGLPRISKGGIMQMNLLFQAFYSFTSQVGLVGLDENMYVTHNKKFENEIIINVPVAIGIMNSDSYGLWKKELTSGDLLASDDDVTVSHDNRILFSLKKLKYSSKLIYERLLKFCSTAPVLITAWMSIFAFIIFINFVYPDPLVFPSF